ncbi:MAG: carboxylating nicotinate-nucleotide diphosphorylase [Polymorphobacter sp.]|uniref:carboxylating nicotinate-nucleotide diphosphorylase n=1 Tax=Polymorphobacter sp. TaxID=1909290 RepID=UPI003A8B230F
MAIDFPVLVEGFDTKAFIVATLAEDLGQGGDITSAATIPASATLTATMNSRDQIIVAGLPLAAAFFQALDPSAQIDVHVPEGAAAAPGTTLMTIHGNARAVLAAERSALNTVQHLSGIANETRKYVDAIAGTSTTLLDTRKTHPGLRLLEKYATKQGGATDHRLRLDDGVLIKDNHIAVAGSVHAAVAAAHAAGLQNIVVEVDTLDQIEQALAAGADRLLLDNMGPPMLREALAIIAGRVPAEASGGVTLQTIRAIAQTGVNFISVGRITQSAPSADIGLDFG